MSDERAYPQHSETQDKEERSKRLLEQLAPTSWQIRPITERDVGIDGEAEIRVNNRYTGLFFKYQLKSTDSIEWSMVGSSRSSAIKSSTANYWLGLEIPVFLFQADLVEGAIYFRAVGAELRRRFGEFQDQKTLSIELSRELRLGRWDAAEAFDAAFRWERALPRLAALAERFLLGLEASAIFLEISQGRDFHMEADESLREQIRVHYETHVELRALLGLPSVEPYDDLITRLERELGSSGGFHEYTVTELCRSIEVEMPNHATRLMNMFAVRERAFWLMKCPTLVSQCDRLSPFVAELQQRVQIASVGYRWRMLGSYPGW